ncbi:MAG: DUF5682 family protein [Oscillospiraceae bacterium]|nr:DUF5682 family protein [Oscillospiraceae bacterium]
MQIFGIRHLSPASAFHLSRLLDAVQPQIVLIEGPDDATAHLDTLTHCETRAPVALMAYTIDPPIRSILMPYADYSPELIAIRWAHANGVTAQYIDLPSSIFCALHGKQSDNDRTDPNAIYHDIARRNGYDNYNAYWEAVFEHCASSEDYALAISEFAETLRKIQPPNAINLVREAYMRRQIAAARQSGIPDNKIVVVCGAYHAPALYNGDGMTDQELSQLPALETALTAMPYAYSRLSTQSGYGAGNESPHYFQLLWQALQNNTLTQLPTIFLTQVTRQLRNQGNIRSTAEIIDTVQLARRLADLRNAEQPTLQDLRAAAVTCLGQGELSVISEAMHHAEIGTAMGQLPVNTARTALQNDFAHQLRQLKLGKFHADAARTLTLDLRKPLDLRRSFFLHRLYTLGVSFAAPKPNHQHHATWKETFTLQWSPDIEVELVETSLLSASIEQATLIFLHESLSECSDVSDITRILQQSALCGLPDTLRQAQQQLAEYAIDNDDLPTLANAVQDMSAAITYGSLRRVDAAPLSNLLAQLFLRAVLQAPAACSCNAYTAPRLQRALHTLHITADTHSDIVNISQWHETLRELTKRDDINPQLAGYATAVQLSIGQLNEATLDMHLHHRLSVGTPAPQAAQWFEGLATLNHYALLLNPLLWQLLNTLIETLQDEDFLRILVVLRRTFSNFSRQERRNIWQHLGEIWCVSDDAVEYIMSQELLTNDFNFEEYSL